MIAEKPLAARRIAEILAEKNSLKKRKILEVEVYEFKRNGKKYVIVPAVGHLFGLHNKLERWTYPTFEYEWLPIFKVNKKAGFAKKYFEVIEEVAKDAKDFIICTDYDVEGSVIGYNILSFICKQKNAKRMKFSTLTKEEIINSFENPLPSLDFLQIEAGLTRHIIDWLWGINLTRALTISLKNNPSKVFSIISTGRVQGPTLAILYEKEKEIKNFKPKTFWQVYAEIKLGTKKFVANFEKEKVWKAAEAKNLLKLKVKEGVIVEVKKRTALVSPPVPFNTVELQTEAFNFFKFSPTQTMQIAENLYQLGLISYPRTSSQRLPKNLNFKQILKALGEIGYAKYVSEILKGELKPREGKKTDPAHPAIYPTFETENLKKLNKNELKLYDLIVRRFLACFGKPAKRTFKTLKIKIGDKIFVLRGKETLEAGWLKFYPYLTLEEVSLPQVKKGAKVKVLAIKAEEKQTQPPKRYTQGSILKEMEKRNLGTKATRAEILKTLYERGYIVGKSIKVTKFGEIVVKVLKEYCPRILSEELTRKLENEMELIIQGKKKRREVVEEAKEILSDILKEFKQNELRIGKKLAKFLLEFREEKRILGKCPKCGNNLILIKLKNGKQFVGCASYPKCKNAYPLPSNARIVPLYKVCEKCGTPLVQVFRKGKRPFRMCLDPNCETKKNWKKT